MNETSREPKGGGTSKKQRRSCKWQRLALVMASQKGRRENVEERSELRGCVTEKWRQQTHAENVRLPIRTRPNLSCWKYKRELAQHFKCCQVLVRLSLTCCYLEASPLVQPHLCNSMPTPPLPFPLDCSP